MGKATVLIVDDEEAVHDLLGLLLHEFERVSAYSGWEALRVLRERAVDVVLLDLNLSEMTGLEVLRELRASGHDVPVMVLTGFPTREAAREARALGAVQFLDKSQENYAGLPRTVTETLPLDRREAGSAPEEIGEALVRELLASPEMAGLARALDGAGGALDARRKGPIYHRLRRRFQSIVVRLALQRSGGNKKVAARALGVSTVTIRERSGGDS